MTRFNSSAFVLLTASLILTTGCSSKKDGGKAVAKKGHDHDHPDKGPHGGMLLEWGADEYHVEPVFDRDKKLATIYILDGATAKVAAPIAIEEVTLTLTHTKVPIKIAVKADPDKSDPKGKSSRFVANHDALGDATAFKGSISATVGATPYSDDFEEKEEKKK